jgi:CheY-like chemotaxis protein
MDVNMPKMDGLKATKKIREMIMRKEIPHTYIIIVSAFDN